MKATVVGSGIIGLTSALRLREAGHDVQVVSAAPPLESTSSIAAAIWYPYLAWPRADVLRWSARTFEVLNQLQGAGVLIASGRDLFTTKVEDPWWRDAVTDFGRVPAADLPPGYVDGYALTVPVVDMAVHLTWLTAKVQAAGVSFHTGEVADLDQPLYGEDVLINCTGLGASKLANDGTLTPVRGQIIVVEQIGLTNWILDDQDPDYPTYVVPRTDTIVLGGTAVTGDYDRAVRPETADIILKRCMALEPRLENAKIIGHKVGLRPSRPAVRLELESRARPVIHNYGHGGAGVTMSYGCAEDVVRLVDQLS